ncbi:hypothetical protein AVEN_140904-1 [Araneus ventricosus]|uniref:Uncharacterized protein n=1 Tax=Araneus ventricosus TaxID=182803 RepID=A0A4Y2HW07_ARAVE|nr:hypothetical protein AVEN_140904-1 [Araneus ventricosus]
MTLVKRRCNRLSALAHNSLSLLLLSLSFKYMQMAWWKFTVQTNSFNTECHASMSLILSVSDVLQASSTQPKSLPPNLPLLTGQLPFEMTWSDG